MFGSAASSRYATAAISPGPTLRHVVPRNSDSDCIYRIVVVNMLHMTADAAAADRGIL